MVAQEEARYCTNKKTPPAYVIALATTYLIRGFDIGRWSGDDALRISSVHIMVYEPAKAGALLISAPKDFTILNYHPYHNPYLA